MVIQIRFRASTQLSLGHLVRLACLRHAASVHPEPGSNSPKKIFKFLILSFNTATQIDVLLSFQRTFLLASFSKPLITITNFKKHVNNKMSFFYFFIVIYKNNYKNFFGVLIKYIKLFLFCQTFSHFFYFLFFN